MSDVVKHAQTHRSRGIGGTDPVPPDLPMIVGQASSQAITANAEIEWDSAFTTDPDTFRYDPSDPAGLLIQRNGVYQYMATLRVAEGSITLERGIAIFSGPLSSGPIGGTAFKDVASAFTSGFTEINSDSDAGDFTTILWENDIAGSLFVDVFDPRRVALVVDHVPGNDFTAINCVLYIFKLNSIYEYAVVPPLPQEPPP